jgi:hypothetical protein
MSGVKETVVSDSDEDVHDDYQSSEFFEDGFSPLSASPPSTPDLPQDCPSPPPLSVPPFVDHSVEYDSEDGRYDASAEDDSSDSSEQETEDAITVVESKTPKQKKQTQKWRERKEADHQAFGVARFDMSLMHHGLMLNDQACSGEHCNSLATQKCYDCDSVKFFCGEDTCAESAGHAHWNRLHSVLLWSPDEERFTPAPLVPKIEAITVPGSIHPFIQRDLTLYTLKGSRSIVVRYNQWFAPTKARGQPRKRF